MADVLVGSVKEVVRLALLVKEAADTVRRNKASFVKLTNTVDLMRLIVAPLEDMDMSGKPGMRAALTSLEEALRQGLDLVTHCQRERNILSTLFSSRNLSNELVKVREDINAQIMYANFALTANTYVSVTIVRDSPAPIEGAGVTENSNTSGESFSIKCMAMHIVEENDHDPELPTLNIFQPSDLDAATNNFSEKNVIGLGGSATFYKGALPNDLVVAIKTYPDQSGPQSIRHYFNVFQLLLGHENVVKFLGFCHVEGREMVVEEYMPNGSLFEIINGSSQKLNWLSTIRLIEGVAKGVAYLHSKHVIHLDLNPANIVFDSNMNPKISNFERSKLLDKNVAEAVSLELVGRMGYMSPEYVKDGIISMMSDVFSFGVLLLHSISGMRNSILEKHPIAWAWEVREAKGMNGLLDSSWGSEHQLEEMKRCMEIGLMCTQELPKDRPTMPEVVKFLNKHEIFRTPKKPCFI